MKPGARLVLAITLAALGLCVAFAVANAHPTRPLGAFDSPLFPPVSSANSPLTPPSEPPLLPASQGGGSPLTHDAVDRDTKGIRSLSSGFAPGWNRTSDFMIGRVVVAILLPESNGVISPSVENWTAQEIDFVKQEVEQGLQWWAQQAQAQSFNVPLEFVIPSTHPITVPTGYEPIQMIGLEAPFGEADIWISDTMAHLGYTDPGMDYAERVTRYDDDLRQAYQADWAFTVFVVDDSDNGFFAPGSWGIPDAYVTAWAMRPGPYHVMTDLSGYAARGVVDDLGNVVAHEIGHVFGAADEVWADGSDCGTGSTCDRKFGYLGVENQNCNRRPQQCALDRPDCVMRAADLDYLCPYSAGQVGWRDSDSDGVVDPIDTAPELTITGYPIDPSPFHILEYSAEIADIPWPTMQLGYTPVAINKVSVQYQISSTSGSWVTALPGDGAWDSSYEEGFRIPIFDNGTYTIYLRAVNEVGRTSTVLSHTVTISSTEPVYRIRLPLALRNY